MAAIVFVPADFKAAFSAFANTANPALEMNFGFATDIISDFAPCGTSDQVQTRYLYLMTAHISALSVLIAAGESGQIVTGATIDKVSVTLQPPPEKNQWQWWLNQTPYGQQLLAILQAQSAGGFFIGGTPERAGFRSFGGRYY